MLRSVPFLSLLFWCLTVVNAQSWTPPPAWEALHDSADWKLIVQNDSLRVYTKLLPVASIPALRVEIETTASPQTLLNLAWSVERYPTLFDAVYVTRAGVIEKGDTAQVGWQVIETPLLHPRLYVFRQIRSQHRIDWVQVPLEGESPCSSCVLPTVNFGSWEVVPFQGRTRLIYRVCTNPGGSVPAWLVDQANRRYLPKMLRLLVRAAQGQPVKDE